MKIAIFAAGTGGHIYPALSIAEKFGKENVLFIASNREIEKKIYKNSGFKVCHLNISGFRGKNFVQKLLWPFNTMFCVLISIFLLIKYKPRDVLLMGNYISVIGLISSICLFKNIYIHEQNSILGTANKLGLIFAKKLFSTFPLKEKKEYNLGQPIRSDFNELNYDTHVVKEHILVLGGSQGAAFFNNQLAEILNNLNLNEKILFQTGVLNKKISTEKIEYVSFIENMPEVMAKSKFIICRSGASTVAEVQSLGLPAIFIPLPSSIDDHQMKNAMLACNDGGGVVLDEKKFDSEVFSKKIIEFNSQNFSELSNKMRKSIHLKSAEKIVNEIK
jgi:UDP-N-acetylglucosamine--N-acetylmuramyl-(pentapeptide) pyrophosphoryl-undecaprenol N-acetylglucosamine transferase